MVVAEVNVTVEPASAAVATFCHTRVVMLDATFDASSDQPVPEGVSAAVALFEDALRTSPSPGTTVVGTCTDHAVELVFTSRSPMNEMPGAVAETLTACVVVATSPFAAVTVNVMV